MMRKTIWLFLSVAVFTGLGFTYYHNEILVLLGWYLNVIYQPNVAVLSDIETVSARTETAGRASVIQLPNLEEPLPLVYSDTLEEEIIQEHLKEGAVVLPLGPVFGDSGNVVVTAHSSGTLAFGPYRQAFARLSELEAGQEFTVETEKATYTYRVYGKEVVWPHEVDKLPDDDRSTVTLVTCWPLWTNFKRLLVHSELVDSVSHEEPRGQIIGI